MKRLIVSLSFVVGSALSLSAADVLTQAKDSGLIPLPTNQAGV